MSNFRQTAAKLANEFINVIHKWLTADQIATVISENEMPENAGNCATHDFCDSNMAMDEAFNKVMGRGFTFGSDAADGSDEEKQYQKDTDLFNAAWSIAKIKKFKKN